MHAVKDAPCQSFCFCASTLSFLDLLPRDLLCGVVLTFYLKFGTGICLARLSSWEIGNWLSVACYVRVCEQLFFFIESATPCPRPFGTLRDTSRVLVWYDFFCRLRRQRVSFCGTVRASSPSFAAD